MIRVICFVDSQTIHTILKERKKFLIITLIEAKVNTILRSMSLVEGFRRAIIILKIETKH